MADQDYIGVEGLQYPENGVALFQEDFEAEQSAIGEEIIDRESDLFSFGIIEGFAVSASATAGCVDVAAGKARDLEGRRLVKAATTGFIVPDSSTVKVIVRHLWVDESYTPEGSSVAKTLRRHSAEIAYIGSSETPGDDEQALALVTRSGNTVTVDSDLREFVELCGIVLKDNGVKLASITEKVEGAGVALAKAIITSPKIIAPTFMPKIWATGITYYAGEAVLRNYCLYFCMTDHVAGTFATDWLTSGYWYCLGAAPGMIKPFAGITIPPGWLLCDKSSLLKTSYPDLWANFYKSIGTCTSATSGLITSASSHGLKSGQRIYFTGTTTGGITVYKTYWITYISDTTFYISSSWANYIAGTYVTISAAGSFTGYFCPWGIPETSETNFYLPDLQGVFMRGGGTNNDMYNANSEYYVGALGAMGKDKLQGHYHALVVYSASTQDQCDGGATACVQTDAAGYAVVTLSTNNQARGMLSDGTNGTPRTGAETNPANVGMNFIIKY